MMTNEHKLRNVLKGNAVFSSLSGLSLAVFHQFIAQWMGITWPEILLIIGVGLLLFAASLFVTASQKTLKKGMIQMIIYQDWTWVAGSAIILAFQLFDLHNIAYWLIADVAIVVAAFAIFQMKYLKGLATELSR